MRTAIIALFVSLTTLAHAQNGIDDLDYNVEGFGTISINNNQLGAIPFYGVGIYPRLNFYTPADYFSLGVGTPANIGVDFVAGSFGTQILFFTDVPLELSMNIGERATKDGEFLFGGYMGAGVDYNFSYFVNSFSNTKVSLHSFGPHASIGFRWRYFSRPLGVRLSVMYGVVNNYKEDPTIINDQNITPTIYNLSVVYGMQ